MAGSERARVTDDENRGGAVVVPLPGAATRPAQTPPAQRPALDDVDPVTGLPGRERFEAFLGGAARRRRGDERPWAAVAVVEGVAALADRAGRQAAEELIRTVAAALRVSLRDS